MKAKVVAIKESRTGVRLSLAIATPTGARRLTCRVSRSLYEEVGAPLEGEALEEVQYLLLAQKEERAAAYDRAVQILSMGDNSYRGLYRKLLARGFVPSEAEAAVARLVEEGYLDEAAMLARQFAIYAKKRLGMAKILPSLLQKGFSRTAILAAAHQAQEAGIYLPEEIKASLLEECASLSPEEKHKLLKKHGFLS